ncbi:MAG: molybdopterin molybdenumtransferase MoeA [Hadesarchaea archaeon]|nr:molybdopterin molybdenumtransferase MoeA [Hadesarchaea archaeon]
MKDFLNVLTLEEAQNKLEEYWQPQKQTNKINIKKASGRVLARDAISRVNLPPFDRATVDGYAVQASDTFGAEEDEPIELSKKGEIHAGDLPRVKINEGSCATIATGAVIPEGANAVVKVEETSEENGIIKIRRAVSPKENISGKGSEIKKGEPIAPAGRRILPQVHGALFAAGIREVKVIKKPSVAVISSGEELVNPNEELGPSQIYDVNGPMICDAVSSCGGQPDYLGIVRDDFSSIKDKIREALNSHDIIITSGGSSAGSKDIVPEAINELGEPGVISHGLAQKPGKPTLIAVVENKPVFGLPGYPVSALMVFNQLVAPYIRELASIPEPREDTLKATLTRKVLSARGRRELLPVKIIEEKGELLAQPLRKGSGAITSLADSTGFTEISINQEILEKGEKIEVNAFGGFNHA